MRVRVLPDVTGLDKEFDYAAAGDDPLLTVGALVRVPLHGRRVAGWVTALDPPDAPVDDARLQPVRAVVSRGPAPELLDLAGWASVRWAAGRLRPFLVAASPPTRVRSLPAARRTATTGELGPIGAQAVATLDAGGGVLVIPPATSPVEAIVAAARRGPALATVPTVARATAMAAALRRRGLTTALVPRDWAAAASGVDVVIGARVAAWAPCPSLAAVVVVDEHDEALQEERAPTWHARDVLLERARRAGIPVLLTSPAPTVAGLDAAGRLDRLPVDVARAGWPIVDVVDRTAEEPWKTSLVTPALIRHLRNDALTVVCVHNTPGRGRILACRSCKALLRCERCDAAMAQPDDTELVCPRCATVRARVCQQCGGSAFANLRPGVTRLREELAAAANRPAVAVTGGGDARPDPAGVYVGTEAVLHRVEHADVVAFLDFDRELLAPRYRAAEQAMSLLVKAARLLGPRSRGGRLLVQTFLPGHEVLRAALLADPTRLLAAEGERRELLELPPVRALATVTGAGSAELAATIERSALVEVGGAEGSYTVRAPDWTILGEALIAAKQAAGSRARIAVDPPRA
jgi:primosomal protein N' (replication factor Y) (superfamily II helicase)